MTSTTTTMTTIHRPATASAPRRTTVRTQQRWALDVRARAVGAVVAAVATWALLAGIGHIADAQFEASAGAASSSLQWAGHTAQPRG